MTTEKKVSFEKKILCILSFRKIVQMRFLLFLSMLCSLVDYFRNIQVSKARTGLEKVLQIRHLAGDTGEWMEIQEVRRNHEFS